MLSILHLIVHFLSILTTVLYKKNFVFKKGPENDDFEDEDQDEFPNFKVSSSQAPLQPQQDVSTSEPVPASLQSEQPTDSIVSTSTPQPAVSSDQPGQPTDSIVSNSQSLVSSEQPEHSTDNIISTSQPLASSVQINPGHFTDSTDVTTQSTVSSVPAESKDSQQESISSHILDMPVQCDVAPLQPFVSQEVNIKEPLIGGSTSFNLSFELAAQEGKYSE